MEIKLSDPYPLDPTMTDGAAMEYSRRVDEWLGFDIPRVEEELHRTLGISPMGAEQEYWVGLNIQSLLTPYTEIRKILNDLGLKPGERLIDLGAAYGRIGFVMGHNHPDCSFIGYEAVKERVEETVRCLVRWNYSNVSMIAKDLTDPGFVPADADYYFIYDYGTRPAVEKTLNDLKEIARRHPITVIGRGRLSRDAIERHHPWLSQVNPPRHFKNYSFYFS